MTPKQKAALHTFTEALYDALDEIAPAAFDALEHAGLDLQAVKFDIFTKDRAAIIPVGLPMNLVDAARSVGVEPPPSRRDADNAFLKLLRIKPDLEVRHDP